MVTRSRRPTSEPPAPETEERQRPTPIPAPLLAAGNQALARRLQRTVTYSLRGVVKPVPTQANLVTRVQGYLNQSAPTEAALFPDLGQIRPKITDDVIDAETQGFLADATPRTIKDVAAHVFGRVRERELSRLLLQDGQHVLPGVRVAVLNPTAGGAGVAPRTAFGTSAMDLHSPYISFRAIVSVDATPAAVQGWQVGITQTVLHVDRKFSMRVDAAAQTWVTDSTTTLPAPTNDRNAGATAPWYSQFRTLDGVTRHNEVTLTDMPGESFNVPPGAITGLTHEGVDRFGTWVILWHPATQRARFLGGWAWNVDYGHAAGTRTQVTPYASRIGVSGDPAEAVLTGARCRDVLQSVTSAPRLIGVADQQRFATAESSDRTRKAFADAATAFEATPAVAAARDRTVAAWQALAPEHRTQNDTRLLALLGQYELTANGRAPSQDALRAQYNVR